MYPILTAVLYVYLYPIIGMTGVWAYRTYQVRTANLVNRIEKNRTLSKQEADELTRWHERDRKKWEDESVLLGKQLDSLREALDAAEAEVSKLKTVKTGESPKVGGDATPSPMQSTGESPKAGGDATPSSMQSFVDTLPSPAPSGTPLPTDGKKDLQRELSSHELKLMIILSDSSDSMSIDLLSRMLGVNLTLTETMLMDLAADGLVQRDPDDSSDWLLTNRGKTVAVSFMKANPQLTKRGAMY